MSATIPASPSGTLILHGRSGHPVQYSLENVVATFSQSWTSHRDQITLEARMAGEHFVDLSDRRDEELALLLELYGEQARLGASDEALATTRHRIREHIKKETA